MKSPVAKEGRDPSRASVRRRDIVKVARSAEGVAEAIRSAIVAGKLPSGVHIRQEEWAQRAGISRGPIREALKMLVIEGLLTYDPHRGYFVTQLDPSEISQLYDVRILLETAVLRSISWPDEAEMATLRRLATDVLESVKTSNVHALVQAQRAFQFAIWELSPLDFLVNEVKRYWNLSEVYRALIAEEIVLTDHEAGAAREHHKAVFEALKAHDQEKLISHYAELRQDSLDRLHKMIVRSRRATSSSFSRP